MRSLPVSEAVFGKIEMLAETHECSVESFLDQYLTHTDPFQERRCPAQHRIEQEQIEAVLQREKMLHDMKSNLISIMAHEFRTPLAVIMSTADILRLKRQTISEVEVVQRLHLIEEQVKRLNEMVSEMSFVNQDEIIGHILKPAPVDITQFFFEIAHDINTVYPHHLPIEIIDGGSCDELTLDSCMMRQLFSNLLSNAMKYSPSDTTVTCGYSCQNGMVNVVVADQGIGIPVEDQPHLFDAFYRAKNVGSISGTGLGMWIVKRAVDALDGRIIFESTIGIGTSFFVSLPVITKNA
jgi:signal transduction histidine kinase